MYKPRVSCSETMGYRLDHPNLEQVQGRRALIGMCVGAHAVLRDRRRPSHEEREGNSALGSRE